MRVGPRPQEKTLPGTQAPPQWVVNLGCEEQLWAEGHLTSSPLSALSLSLDFPPQSPVTGEHGGGKT